jgi:NADH:ubiquinone oxidoreductase subunit 6 (subunit J)
MDPTTSNAWHLWLPIVLGGVAVYLLLPRPDSYTHRRRRWLGALFAAAAIVCAGRFLVQATGTVPQAILFYGFSAIAIGSAGLMLTQINPVHAALSFALVVLSTCGLFLLQSAPFLMAATTIVYAGAIVVTFLFVIMLAQQAGRSDADHRSREPLLATISGFVLLAALLYLLQVNYDTSDLDAILARIRQAKKEPTAEAMIDFLKAKDEQGDPRLGIFDELIKKDEKDEKKQVYTQPPGFVPRPTLADRIDVVPYKADWDQAWSIEDREQRLEALRKVLSELEGAVMDIRDQYGSMKPGVTAPPRSSYSEEPIPGTAGGEPAPGHLPVENTAHLGRTLFTDFLVGVELAGTLLMVAVVGAIAIAYRRPEDARR